MEKIIDEKAFSILKNTMKTISCVKHGKEKAKDFRIDMPASVGLKLTNRCNLRCKHCYEWSEHGYCHEYEKKQLDEDLSLDVLRKILTETKESNSGFYLWGGEPLCYSHFDELAKLMEGQDRICVICTNSILIKDKLESLIKIGKNLEIVIAMEGFEEENDSIRGTGVFRKIQDAIALLLEERNKGNFHGKLTIHTVITQKNYNKLFEYTKFVEQLGVDSLILCFPWYISDETSYLMEQCMQEKFTWLPSASDAKERSWDSFKYGLEKEFADEIATQLNKINQHSWKFAVRYVPKIKPEEIHDFISGQALAVQGRKACNSISMRMDVMPDGSVSTCKHFKEFTIGNLKEMGVHELWNCEAFNRVRTIISDELMPICAQCNNLYLHGE